MIDVCSMLHSPLAISLNYVPHFPYKPLTPRRLPELWPTYTLKPRPAATPQAYHVNISLRQRANYSTASASSTSAPIVIVMIRGSVPEADNCREATVSLMKHFTGNQTVCCCCCCGT